MQQSALFPPELTRPNRIWLVDGHHLAYRSYFAFEKLSTSRGEPTQAVFGFIRTILRLLKEDGDCVIAVFDAPARTFRDDLYEEYKAGRAPTPDDFRPQLKRIKHVVDLLGLKRLEAPGFEADDVIGTLAKLGAAEGYPVKILTGDRDSFQLISEKIRVQLPDGSEMGTEAVREKYGVSVQQWVDYRALTGDSSDNIPGAKGVGPKTAAKLLEQWGSLEAILANLEAVQPERIRELIKASLDNVHLSKKLSQIHTDIEFRLDFRECHRREIDRVALKAELEALEFGSILRELGLLEAPKPAQTSAWPPPAGEVWLGYTLSQAQPMWAEFTGLAAFAEGKVYGAPTQITELGRFSKLGAMLAKDLAVLALREGQSAVPGDDPLLLAYLYDPSNSEAAGTIRRYGAGDWNDDPALRAQATAALWDTLVKRTEGDEKLWWLYREIEKPLAGVLAQMEARGVALDAPYLMNLLSELSTLIGGLEAEVHTLAGHSFNLNSRDQLETVLYDELKLAASGKKTTTGKRSTAASVLEEMSELHAIVPKILEYRELTKLKSTYLEPLPKLVHPKTGRLHTRFNQTGTATGRLSSLDPNLQNIPVRSELGRRIRKGFVAGEGYRLIAADYSQIELRVLAHLCGDENLTTVFTEKKDIHTQTAAWMFGLKLAEVKPEMRRAAKTINFGVLYGMSAHRLSNELGITYAEAEGFIERYFASYPKVREWIDATLEQGREKGCVETLFGRKRFVSDLDAKNRSVREAAERMAFNMPVQGTAADLMKLAMVNLQPELEKLDAHMVLQVHDELIIEAPQAKAKQIGEKVREVMEGVWKLDVPLETGVGIGDNWLEAK